MWNKLCASSWLNSDINKTCVLILSQRLKHFSFKEELSEISQKNCTCVYVNHPVFFSDFNQTWTLSEDFQKEPQISLFFKISLLGTDIMTLVGAWRNFTQTPKKEFASNNARTKQNLWTPCWNCSLSISNCFRRSDSYFIHMLNKHGTVTNM